MTGSARILIVDDSAFMRMALRQIVTSEPGLSVLGEARDGAEAVALNRSLKPDIVTMDVEMPGLDGLEATRAILAEPPPHPVIIMVSKVTQEGATAAIRALQLGAVDFVSKSSALLNQDLAQVDQQLRAKLRFWSQQQLRGPGLIAARPQAVGEPRARRGPVDLVVVAASTGGPQVLRPLLSAAGPLCAPVLIAQHMPARYTASLAEVLRAETGLDVVEGAHRMELPAGRVVVLPGGTDAVVAPCTGGGAAFELRVLKTESIVHPCADLLFGTACLVAREPIGVILTGMGRDATEGAAKLHARGCPVLVQDPQTCVVAGMPSAAIAAGLATETLCIGAIGRRLQEWAGPPRRE